MDTLYLSKGAAHVHSFAASHSQTDLREPVHANGLEALRKRSYELLNKFRTSWNELEYQEWCAIQRILHKSL
ncbi:hypothetical protein [Sphingobacterium deserti]|uniref:Uncharacterized protein n=1 Tax=Sphingobacterium deserti TaxID=1229276 RepID=A0A0B8T6A0_9SPHI|nr:hypothetical protein [Sphingobacterium deserti]KGE13474.1 hypothetical protein DI53_2759 [Sphingobacterium deserti]